MMDLIGPLTVNTSDFPDEDTDFTNVQQAIDAWLNTNR
jgi:hypothetical protein